MLAPDQLGVAAGQLDGRREPPAQRGVPGQPGQPAPGGEPLPAAALPARAGRAVGVDDHVAGLAREPVGASDEAAARRSTPAPMPVPRVTTTRLGHAAGGSAAVLGHGVAVGVVVDHDRQAEAVRQRRLAAGGSTTPCRCAPARSTPSWSTRPGTPTPTAADGPCRGRSAPRRHSTMASTRPVAARRRGHPPLGQHLGRDAPGRPRRRGPWSRRRRPRWCAPEMAWPALVARAARRRGRARRGRRCRRRS